MFSVSISFGVHIGQQNMPMSDLRALWRRLDDAGVDWISIWDHLYEAPPAGGTVDHFEGVATLGALAADTRQARLGCLVFCVLYRNPGLLAKAAVTIDHISGGRFELGLGAGWHQWEAEAYGYDFPGPGRRLDMLEEAVPLIRSLLTEPRTTHDGRYFRAENASCLPAPLQSRLPIWVGGTGERRTLHIAASYADGWNAAYVSADRYGHLTEVLADHCQSSGRDPATIRRSVNLIFALSNDGKSAEDVIAQQGWGPMAPIVRGGAISGPPDSAAEQIQRYINAGAQEVNVALRAPWDDVVLDQYLDQLPVLRKLS
jgi:alkanesulfonate monooxygenase SsuD/methylene tetrahydromethanopterin reductase-like flavin-dependent oxidoreductase (luciferase family)